MPRRRTRPAIAAERQVRGDAVGSAQLTAEQVIAICAQHREGDSYADLAQAYGVSKSTILANVKRWTWQHL